MINHFHEFNSFYFFSFEYYISTLFLKCRFYTLNFLNCTLNGRLFYSTFYASLSIQTISIRQFIILLLFFGYFSRVYFLLILFLSFSYYSFECLLIFSEFLFFIGIFSVIFDTTLWESIGVLRRRLYPLIRLRYKCCVQKWLVFSIYRVFIFQFSHFCIFSLYSAGERLALLFFTFSMKALGELGERDLCDLCVCWLEKGVELGELAELYKKKTILKVEIIPPQVIFLRAPALSCKF